MDECFTHSLMTVHNEQKHAQKYHYLHYVEFQELVCRVALAGVEGSDPVEVKVFTLCQIMWEYMYKSGLWTLSSHPLARVITK